MNGSKDNEQTPDIAPNATEIKNLVGVFAVLFAVQKRIKQQDKDNNIITCSTQ